MFEANRTPCKKLPCTATKGEVVIYHLQKMNRKAAERRLHAGRPTRDYEVRASLSSKHKNYGKRPEQAY